MREVEELGVDSVWKPRKGVYFKAHGTVSLRDMHSKGLLSGRDPVSLEAICGPICLSL